MKNLKKLALAFALAAALPATGALAQPTYNVPIRSTTVDSLFSGSSESGAQFNANKMSYDVDTNTGLCFAATMFRGGNGRMMGIATVPCKPVLNKISPAKRKIYLKKYGAPK